jgi:hypothetical protein
MAVLAGLFAVALTQVPADGQAQPSAPAQPTVPAGGILVQGSTRLDCTSLTAQGRRWATAHHLCTTPAGGVHTQSIVYDSCGPAWLWITNPSPGVTFVTYGVDSMLGPIIYRSLNVHFTFTYPSDPDGDNDNIVITDYPDKGIMLSAYYQNVLSIDNGPGAAAGELTGTVQLAPLANCFVTIPFPKDFKQIF